MKRLQVHFSHYDATVVMLILINVQMAKAIIGVIALMMYSNNKNNGECLTTANSTMANKMNKSVASEAID